ncbi:MAG: Exodeoxyribonuclease, partial [Patescibacteria group bacterium]|nr:Exodeoxyribonuclease [Patescibacteria group bacterium]
MSASLYFYDLETSGVNPKKDRVMQFAGQRTNLDLEPIQDPDVFYVKMTDDVLPDPGAILVTGITPQQTISDGISEKEFADFIYNKVAIPQTTIVGYNSVRFDNEFIRFLLYRNYFDAYEWSYKNNVSVWDLLDVVRMTRALRPDGIKWPFASDGKPTNRLEKLTGINKIDHIGAHDALSDVKATIGVAKLIKKHQPKLFSYLYDMRSKQAVINLVNSGMPFVYTSGRYDANYQKTTVAINLCEHPVYGASRVIVYDLRYDPTEFLGLSIEKLVERMQFTK